MNIGIVNVDSKMANYALMKISSYHKSRGDNVEWANPFEHYDIVYKSKILSFSNDDNTCYNADQIIMGGTGYDVKSKLPEEIENHTNLDYSIYPNCNYSIQFFSRGCIRSCSFCIVREKEGLIHPVAPINYNPNGQYIEVFDNNFFANPQWKDAINKLKETNQPVNFHGVDVRIMNEEQASALNSLKLKSEIKIAWDSADIDLTNKLKEVTKYIKNNKLRCYVLVNYNTTIDEDLYRLRKLKEIGILPFVMIYRDPNNKNEVSQYHKDLARWCNRPELFKTMDFKDFSPRKNFKCSSYFNEK